MTTPDAIHNIVDLQERLEKLEAVYEAAVVLAENPVTWGVGYDVATMHALREAIAEFQAFKERTP